MQHSEGVLAGTNAPGALDTPEVLDTPAQSELPLRAEALVPEAARTRRVARLLGLTLLSMLVVSALAPWQQSVSGRGRVVAYAPVERRQPMEAPASGRIVRWHVREGSIVSEGDPIVELADNDPRFVERLGAEKDALSLKLASYEQRMDTLRLQIEAAQAARKSDVLASEARVRATVEKLRSSEQKHRAAEAALETSVLNLGRVRALTERGLSAQRDLELSELGERKARTDRDAAQADMFAAKGDVDASRAGLDKARAEGEAKVREAEAKLRSGESDLADARASVARLDVSIARQTNLTVRAPRRGVVLSMVTAQGSKQVKQGDLLATLVPETHEPAVELWIDGNDAALVSEGRHVRVQFEGFPAVQFAGWPSVAVGTFGGTISLVDPQDDGDGNFRVLVVPSQRSERWPSPQFLRQGARAKGWVLLEQVSIGFELWRRFNGFPPVLKGPPSGANVERTSKDGKT
jgi:multidrug efflux pump subunit AcrA (membrane-fusion protein)